MPERIYLCGDCHESIPCNCNADRLALLADRLERDRKEPDKVLCYVLDMRRLAREMRED